MKSKASISQLLRAWVVGDDQAQDEAVRRLYPDLRRIARARLRNQPPGSSLGPTMLAHEAYLRLANQQTPWEGRAHFLAFASTTMKRLVVDRSRRRRAQKRGNGERAVSFHEERIAANETPLQDDLRRALQKLAAQDERQALIVELRFFEGESIEGCAAQLNLSPATVKREWAMARAWLKRELSAESSERHGH